MKTIYDEVLEILFDSFLDPQDEDDDCYMFNRKQMNKIEKAIELGKLYKEFYEMITEQYGVMAYMLSEKDIIKSNEILEKIKELENEKRNE